MDNVKQDKEIRAFLRRVRRGQSFNLAVWAGEILDRKNKMISMAELERLFGLGFEG
jgi:hypothetical protein